MPTLDWSILRSAFLLLVLPSFGFAVCFLSIIAATTRSDRVRTSAASIAFMFGLTAGNQLTQLIPFWELETGWRSLFWVTLSASLCEVFISAFFPDSRNARAKAMAMSVCALSSAVCLTPWDLASTQPWICVILASSILSNWWILGSIGRQKWGPFAPPIVAIVWGGFAVAILILSHSARFAELGVLFTCSLAGIGLVTATTQQSTSSNFAGPSVFIPGLMIAAELNSYSKIPLLSYVCVAIQPCFLFFIRWRKIEEWFGRHPGALIPMSLIPGMIGVAIAIYAEM